MKNPKILVLVVAYNAASTIERLLERFPRKTMAYVDEVLIADDASMDKTSEIARAYAHKHKLSKVRVMKHQHNKGYGGNQKWGYQYAIEEGYDIVVMVHGDAQYPPEYILPLIDPIVDGKKDFMFGSRMAGHPLRGGMPVYKFFGNIFLTVTENIFLGTRLTEFHSGFRAYRISTLKEMPLEEASDGFHFDSEIIFMLVGAKKRIGEIAIPTFYGDEKCNVNVVNYGLNVLKELMKFTLHRLGLRVYAKYSLKASGR